VKQGEQKHHVRRRPDQWEEDVRRTWSGEMTGTSEVRRETGRVN
jgi:hypothetical protein